MKKQLFGDRRRFCVSMTGILLITFGIALFAHSYLGTDPHNAMLIRISELLSLPLGTIYWVFGGSYFVLQLIFGRRHIGIGTFVNWLISGYITSGWIKMLNTLFGSADRFTDRLIFMIIGILIISAGVSMYQSAGLGVAPYDVLSLCLSERTPLPYFLCRVLLDSVCALVCWRLGGILGIGTIICMFGLGPFIAVFNRLISEPLLNGRAGLAHLNVR